MRHAIRKFWNNTGGAIWRCLYRLVLPPNDSDWVRIEIEELRNGILQAYMRSAQHNDRVLYVCMKAHHMAANKAIVELGGEATELPVLDHFMENTKDEHA